MEKRRSDIAVLIIIVVILVGVLVLLNTERDSTKIAIATSYPKVWQSIPESLADTMPVPKLTNIPSPDGKYTMTFKEDTNKEGKTYTVSVTEIKTGTQNQIYSKTYSGDNTLSVPYNSFSPNDKYIFLIETGPSGSNYFSLSTKGGDPVYFIDSFKEKYPEFTVTDVTGWGGITLIVINTDKKEGGIGPSFWFDVTSNSFTRLSTRFN